MRKSKFTEEQIIGFLKQAAAGVAVAEIRRKGGLSDATHAPVASAQTTTLKTKIVEIAHARRRFGYRRVHDLLRPDFPGVNHKRVYRL
jgi:hypothetical protein